MTFVNTAVWFAWMWSQWKQDEQ